MEILNRQDVSLLPPHFTTKQSRRFSCEKRLWQSAPSAAVTKGGRTFVVCSGDNDCADEKPTNYTVCAYFDRDEKPKLAFYAWHDHEVRMSETLLFLAPNGWLYHFWTQSYVYFDGRGGIWCAICKDPDAVQPKFGRPKRLCDGFMAHNPTVLRDGSLLFPASVWTHMKSPFHPLPGYEKPSVWKCDPQMRRFTYLGGTFDPQPSFTENAVYEKADGSFVMLFRSETGLARAFSQDEGVTWTEKMPFVFPGQSARFMVSRLPSGALLLVTHYDFTGRNNLMAMLSYDDGETFPYKLMLDERDDVSYPSGNVSADGRVTLAYDRERVGAREILLASFCGEDIRKGSYGKNSFTGKLILKGGCAGI